MTENLPFRCLVNPRRGAPGIVVLTSGGFRRARADISTWPGYAPTPLRSLPGIAQEAGIAALHVKDESERFGLGSFKALGGAYAVAGVLSAELARRGVALSATSADLFAGRYVAETRDITVACATDGNHGRSVAWGAQRFGASCAIFVHPGVSQGRIDAIARYGAAIHIVPGTYDDAVRAAAAEADKQGWFIVSDTSWPGYTEIPRDIMQGYRLMADEALDQWTGPPPTHVFIQGGVGGVAAAVSVQMRARLDPAPDLPALELIVVEPERAACLLASAAAGVPTAAGGDLDTVMAGLACGEPSLIAWQELDRAAAAFLAIPDAAAVAAMRRLAREGIVSGKSGAVGLAGLSLAARDPATRKALALGPTSRVLVFNTEGATDPALYACLVGAAPGQDAP